MTESKTTITMLISAIDTLLRVSHYDFSSGERHQAIPKIVTHLLRNYDPQTSIVKIINDLDDVENGNQLFDEVAESCWECGFKTTAQ